MKEEKINKHHMNYQSEEKERHDLESDFFTFRNVLLFAIILGSIILIFNMFL